MKWKSTLLLLAATIGLGAYISLVDLRRPTAGEQARREKRVIDASLDQVTQLVLDLPKAKTTLTRRGMAWTLGPDQVRADADFIGQLLEDLTPLSSSRVLSGTAQHPLNLKAFGLDPAVGWLSLVAGGAPVTLLFGDPAPVGQERYVKRIDRPEVFLVPARVFNSLDQPLERFRDHTLLPLNAGLCQRLAVTAPKASYTLSRSGTAWRLTAPLADDTDHAEVTQRLTQLQRLAIRRFVDDHPQVERLASWGLDHPAAEVAVLAGSPPVQTTLFFGKTLPDEASLRYAKRSDEAPLYAVAAADLDALLKPADGLRSRHCFTFLTGNAIKLSVRWANRAWTVQRSAGGPWTAEGSSEALDRGRIEALLDALADAQVERFAEGARDGLDAPMGSVSVWTSDAAAPQQLAVGAEVRGAKTRYGRLVARRATAILPETLLATLSAATLEQLHAAPQAAAPAATGATKLPAAH